MNPPKYEEIIFYNDHTLNNTNINMNTNTNTNNTNNIDNVDTSDNLLPKYIDLFPWYKKKYTIINLILVFLVVTIITIIVLQMKHNLY